ncbi:MAG: hypothetical protein HZC38_16000 [Chloroflexi bacterium]|nr:hypothetical protein [Chloroflexota bacterium]
MAGRLVDRKRLQAFLERLNMALDEPGAIFLLGGSSLTWRGVKQESADIDLQIVETDDPVPLLDAIAQAGDFIETRVDVMRLAQEMPLPEGYEERAEPAADFGKLTVYHFDPYSIALTKLARSATKDITDLEAMLQSGLIDCHTLQTHFESVMVSYRQHSQRPKYEDFQRKVEKFYHDHCE